MIKIYADIHKNPGCHYIEDIISSHDIFRLNKDEFKAFIKDYVKKHGKIIRTCYSPFVNHIGRFIYEYGKRWCGEEFKVYTIKFGARGKELKRRKEHNYNESGRLTEWTVGYF